MRTLISFTFLSWSLLFFHGFQCQQIVSNNGEDIGRYSTRKLKYIRTLTRIDSLLNGTSKLLIITSIFDAEADSPAVLRNILLNKQELVFFSEDSLFRRINIPVKGLIIKTMEGESIDVLENNIYSVSIVEGPNRWLYKVSGSGIMDSQSEFYGLYTSTGECLWYSYFSFQLLNNRNNNIELDLPNEGLGDLDIVLKNNAIPFEKFNRPNIQVKLKYE